MRVRAAMLASLLALAACGGEPQQEAPAAPEPPPSPPAPPAATAPAPPTAATIPARFIGVWDAETGTCDPASDARLDIAPSDIGFYESHGTLTRIAEAPDGKATLDLAMEGEGDTWEMTMRIGLSGAGAAERLVVRHKAQDGEPAPGPLTLMRCPA
jgi:hypothetical protein